MGKIFQYAILLTIILSVSYAYNKITSTRAQIIPVPYELASINAQESLLASEAQILLIGDHSSETLKPALGRIIQDFDGKFKEEIKVFDWTRPNEGVHRSYHKISSLKKIPPIIIYIGGSSEFYEKLFNEKDIDKVKSNFDLFNDQNIKSLVMLSKYLGQLIYQPIETVYLGDTPISQRASLIKLAKGNGSRAQIYYELHYLIFKNIFSELVNLIKFKGSSIISLTTPVKVTNPPKYVCDNSVSQSIIDYQVSLQKALEKKQVKKYFSLARSLTQASVGNSKSFYIFARFNEFLGRTKNALYNYRLAHVFDCLQEQSNYILNQTIKKRYPLERVLTFMTLMKLFTETLGSTLFFRQLSPQEKVRSRN